MSVTGRTHVGRGSAGLAEHAGSSLGHYLRAELHADHLRVERTMRLDRWLESADRYLDLLRLFDCFHHHCESAMRQLLARSPMRLRQGAERRRGWLRQDLARLGAPSVLRVGRGPALPTVDHQLGAWYVVEGSALGGTVIAAAVRRTLPEVEPAASFFRGDGGQTAARWRDVQAFLAGWPGPRRSVVDGARATFACMEELIALWEVAELRESAA